MFHKKSVDSFVCEREKKKDVRLIFIGIGTMTWSPLACGILTGKYDDGIPLHSRASLKVKKNHRLKKMTNEILVGLWMVERKNFE